MTRTRLGTLFLPVLLLSCAVHDLDEAEVAVRKLRPAPGLRVSLWAAEPQLANPVSLDVDTQGRVFVAETHRYRTSVLDIRHYLSWYYDDLACRTVEDRLAMCRKRLGDGAGKLAQESELIRFLEDRDGDGRADRSTVWADGFDSMADGIASGILAHGRDVYLANIPNLWRLRDEDDDGVADRREKLHTGFGVRFSLTGHDFHGLTVGPDGKLYFSMGDRGLNVLTREGTRLEYPNEGTVLRCDPDGSHLEVYATGLRNPQELAFDKYGNLWTGDNDADMEEEARWVCVVQGGDTGWRIGYQFAADLWINPGRVPGHLPRFLPDSIWIQEGIWKGEAPYQIPPVALVRTGPAGLVYYPGTGLPDRYDHHFFLCEFPGGIRSFSVKPKGAGFEMTDAHEFLSDCLPTDVAIGPDSAFYVTDWVAGWEKTGKGRIFRVSHPRYDKAPGTLAVRTLLREGMGKRSLDGLSALLAHRDRRVRLAAQFELAARDARIPLRHVAKAGRSPLARLHAIWGLGQLGELGDMAGLLSDKDPEVRAQCAKVLGDHRHGAAAKRLISLLGDAESRVRFFAAIALGRIGTAEAVGPLVALVEENADRDPYLRHAGVMGLTGCAKPAQLAGLSGKASRAVRMAALLALRRLKGAEIRVFLSDADTSLVFEAARAINDQPIPAAMDDLARLLESSCPPAATMRAINANFRLGRAAHAERVAAFAALKDKRSAMRVEALRALAAWQDPSGRDRVCGLWRPLGKREAGVAGAALKPLLKSLLEDGSSEVRMAAAEAAARLHLRDAAPVLLEIFRSAGTPAGVRARMLRALSALRDPLAAEAITGALDAPEEELRREALRLLPGIDMAGAPALLDRIVRRETSLRLRQEAIRALGRVKGADPVLGAYLDRIQDDSLEPELRLDVLEAAEARSTLATRLEAITRTRDPKDPFAGWREVLDGGDPELGYKVFFERGEAQCARCHIAGTRGAEVGPNLNGLPARKPKEYILQSILTPNAVIADGFRQVLVKTTTDLIEVGRVEEETPTELRLIRGDGTRVAIPKSRIAARREAEKSAMPEGLAKGLSKRDLRDLIAYVRTLTVPDPKKEE